MKLRHSGILVKNLVRAVSQYERLGWKPWQSVEMLMVQKMKDDEGNIIELIEGNYHPHIAVNWLEDEDGNWIELVEVKK